MAGAEMRRFYSMLPGSGNDAALRSSCHCLEAVFVTLPRLHTAIMCFGSVLGIHSLHLGIKRELHLQHISNFVCTQIRNRGRIWRNTAVAAPKHPASATGPDGADMAISVCLKYPVYD